MPSKKDELSKDEKAARRKLVAKLRRQVGQLDKERLGERQPRGYSRGEMPIDPETETGFSKDSPQNDIILAKIQDVLDTHDLNNLGKKKAIEVILGLRKSYRGLKREDFGITFDKPGIHTERGPSQHEWCPECEAYMPWGHRH